MSKRRWAVVCLAVLLIIWAAPPAWAGGKDLIRKGNQAASSGDLAGAVAFFTQALKAGGLSSANQAVAYNNRGGAHDDMGKADLAIQDFNRAVALDPNFAEAYYNRSYSYEKKGMLKLALGDIKKALDLSPGDAHYGARYKYLLHQAARGR